MFQFNDLTQHDNFFIVGRWGTDSDNLSYSGIMNFTDTQIKTYIDELPDILSNNLYGIGSIFIHENSLDKCLGQKCVSLKGFFSDNCSGMASSMFIGNDFIDDSNIFNSVDLSMSNFSSWICKNYFYKTTMNLNDDNRSIKVSYNKKVPRIKISNDITLSISYSIGETDNKSIDSYLNNITTKSSIFLELNQLKSRKEIEQYIEQIISWYGLVSGNPEKITKVIVSNDDNKFMAFYTKHYNNGFKVNNYEIENHFNIRNEEFILNILQSIKYWFKNYKFLDDVYVNGINPYNYGNTYQKLQASCVSLDIIGQKYKENFNKKSRKSNPSYKSVIKQLITQIFNKKVVELAFKHVQYKDFDDLSSKIKDSRNEVSHGPISLEYNGSLTQKDAMYMYVAIREIIRDWMLRQIKIKENYINNDHMIRKLGNMVSVGNDD